MRRLLFTAIAACTLVAFSTVAAVRPRNPMLGQRFRGIPPPSQSSEDASEYFFDFLQDYFPNAYRPSSSLAQAQFKVVDTNGGEQAPIRFLVGVRLVDQQTSISSTCTAIVHLGNPVTGQLHELYFGEEADLVGCPK